MVAGPSEFNLDNINPFPENPEKDEIVVVGDKRLKWNGSEWVEVPPDYSPGVPDSQFSDVVPSLTHIIAEGVGSSRIADGRQTLVVDYRATPAGTGDAQPAFSDDPSRGSVPDDVGNIGATDSAIAAEGGRLRRTGSGSAGQAVAANQVFTSFLNDVKTPDDLPVDKPSNYPASQGEWTIQRESFIRQRFGSLEEGAGKNAGAIDAIFEAAQGPGDVPLEKPPEWGASQEAWEEKRNGIFANKGWSDDDIAVLDDADPVDDTAAADDQTGGIIDAAAGEPDPAINVSVLLDRSKGGDPAGLIDWVNKNDINVLRATDPAILVEVQAEIDRNGANAPVLAQVIDSVVDPAATPAATPDPAVASATDAADPGVGGIIDAAATPGQVDNPFADMDIHVPEEADNDNVEQAIKDAASGDLGQDGNAFSTAWSWLNKQGVTLGSVLGALGSMLSPDEIDALKEAEKAKAREIARQNENRKVGGVNLGLDGAANGGGKARTKPLKDSRGNLIFDPQTGAVKKSRVQGGLIDRAGAA